MSEIDFQRIAARGGSVENAFEELCCQLASKVRLPTTRFDRYRGDGGDGGVECKAVAADGSATGWQSKYVFDIGGLITQADKSLKTALSVHPDITRYVICFPFDLTGKTARKGKSQTEKFDEWVREAEAIAASNGRSLTIDRWSAHEIAKLLLANDGSRSTLPQPSIRLAHGITGRSVLRRRCQGGFGPSARAPNGKKSLSN
jgi:hypothetical protein